MSNHQNLTVTYTTPQENVAKYTPAHMINRELNNGGDRDES